eukprot:scaffold1834_cov175-Amphora_coffeaeformis.AAC.6
MPVVLVKIHPSPTNGPVHSTEADIKDLSLSTPAAATALCIGDAVDQLDANTTEDGGTKNAEPNNAESDDEDFQTFQKQAQTMTMTEGDGTTVVATTIPPEKGDTADTVKEIVLEPGDSTATALIESTLEHTEQGEGSNSLRSLSIRKLVAELKGAEGSHDVRPHAATDLEEKVLQKGRFVSPKDFELLKVIGMGAFGKVLQVRSKVTGQVLAMKIISKRKLKSKHGYVENVKAERNILTRVKHPFVVTMHCSFQTREKLFILMDFLAGGELFLRIGREGIFLEKTAAFYLAEIILALDHLHQLGIIHRDLKPENVLLGADGHVVLTDFGLAKDFGQGSLNEEERALTICGTQEYMAPEMIARKGYGRAADYWSLGCIAYEMLNGLPPFIRKRNEGSKDLFRKIMTEKVKMPSGASANACKLLKGLLNRNVENRLGTTRNKMFEVGGVAAIKNLPFFEQIDWEKLEKKDVEAPVTLDVDNEHDLQHFHDEFVNMALPRSVIEMSKDDFTPKRIESEHFRGFSFIQDGFVLPERDQKQLDAYWNAVDEDGESASEVASSKCEDEGIPPVVEPKKKRPPRKKKKNRGADEAAGSAPCTPAQSVVGSSPPSEVGEEDGRPGDEVSKTPAVVKMVDTTHTKSPVKPVVTKTAEISQNGKANEKETPTASQKNKEEVKKSPPSLNSSSKAWTPAAQQPKAWSTPSAPKAVAPVLSSTIKPAVEQWQSVGSAKEKLGNVNTRPTPWAKNYAQTPRNNGWNTVAPGSTGRGIPQQPGPRTRPGGNPWGGPASARVPPTPTRDDASSQSSDWRSHAMSGRVPPAPMSDIASSPSSDWRSHTISPRTPGDGRTIRKTPVPPQQQTWPSLDDPSLPSKATLKPKAAASKLQGAWASRR